MSDELQVEIPREFADIIGLSQEELIDYNLEILAFDLYSKGKITLSKASQLLNIKIDIFLKKFRKTHLKKTGGPIDQDEAIKDADAISKSMKKWLYHDCTW